MLLKLLVIFIQENTNLWLLFGKLGLRVSRLELRVLIYRELALLNLAARDLAWTLLEQILQFRYRIIIIWRYHGLRIVLKAVAVFLV